MSVTTSVPVALLHDRPDSIAQVPKAFLLNPFTQRVTHNLFNGRTQNHLVRLPEVSCLRGEEFGPDPRIGVDAPLVRPSAIV
jgi:hypothetical protein